MPPLWFKSLHPFQGDRFSGQLSFPAGALIVADSKSKPSGGWAYGCCEKDKGWFPINYVVPIEAPPDAAFPATPITEAPTSSMSPTSPVGGAGGSVWDLKYSGGFDGFPGAVDTSNSASASDADYGGGFDGPIMGGSCPTVSTVSYEDASTETGVSCATTASPSRSKKKLLPAAVGGGFRKAGKGISTAASKTGQGISSAASKAGHGISNAAKETKYRVQDMKEQKQSQKQLQPQPEQEPIVTSTTSSPKRSGWFGSKTTTVTVETTVTEQGTTKTTTETTKKRHLFNTKTDSNCKTEVIPSQQQQRCTGDSMGKNAANGAARGALVYGVVGTAFGGNPVKCATRGAVVGGAFGATKGWKPFK